MNQTDDPASLPGIELEPFTPTKRGGAPHSIKGEQPSRVPETGELLEQAESEAAPRLRFSVSLVRQGSHLFYTLTMPSDVLARTCSVTTRKEDPVRGFQRELDEKRAREIATYIDEGLGTIPNSIVLSAQPAAELKVIGRGKTIEFVDRPAAFLILDGQHRVFGLSKRGLCCVCLSSSTTACRGETNRACSSI